MARKLVIKKTNKTKKNIGKKKKNTGKYFNRKSPYTGKNCLTPGTKKKQEECLLDTDNCDMCRDYLPSHRKRTEHLHTGCIIFDGSEDIKLFKCVRGVACPCCNSLDGYALTDTLEYYGLTREEIADKYMSEEFMRKYAQFLKKRMGDRLKVDPYEYVTGLYFLKKATNHISDKVPRVLKF